MIWFSRRFADRLNLLERRVMDMPTRTEFDAAKAAVAQKISDCQGRVVNELQKQSDAIQALRDQLAAGNPVTDQDLADLQAFGVSVDGIAPAPAA